MLGLYGIVLSFDSETKHLIRKIFLYVLSLCTSQNFKRSQYLINSC